MCSRPSSSIPTILLVVTNRSKFESNKVTLFDGLLSVGYIARDGACAFSKIVLSVSREDRVTSDSGIFVVSLSLAAPSILPQQTLSSTMKILVGVKRVVDYAVKVRVANGTVELANVKQSMNPFCEVRRSRMILNREIPIGIGTQSTNVLFSNGETQS